MQLLSSSKSQFPLFSLHSPNPHPNPSPNLSRLPAKLPVKPLPSPLPHLKSSPPSSKTSSAQVVQDRAEEETKSPDGALAVRRPKKEAVEDESGDGDSVDDGDRDGGDGESRSSSKIEERLNEIAKKMPLFEPERGDAVAKEKPLGINLELTLYRAKVLTKNFEFDAAEKILRKCILIWPEDGRPYVALGKLLNKQSRFSEARSVYERGCQATQGENPYIWQCWAVLENKVGNVRRARELFDAATVADKRHIAAWHGWAVLEIKEGNLKKARNLLGKGLKYCGGNEYVYQTLALLEAKGQRYEQARYLFQKATKCNPKSCASWLAWAQVEVQQENNQVARHLFEKAVQASPKNRFAWHVWALFEVNLGYIDKGRKLLRIGHALNPRDPVILQSLALLEYKHSSASLARVLFRRASELDSRHQPVWLAWAWMEWKEGNLQKARELYQKVLSIDSASDCAARCLQAWGVLEQRSGNLAAARRLFRSSLNINSQSYVTWMTWASLEEDQGNPIRAEEIRNLYFQQRTEIVDDASWVTGFLDIFDPALDSIRRLLNLEQGSGSKGEDLLRRLRGEGDAPIASSSRIDNGNGLTENENGSSAWSDFDLDAFIQDKLSLDASKLDDQLVVSKPYKTRPIRKNLGSDRKYVIAWP